MNEQERHVYVHGVSYKCWLCEVVFCNEGLYVFGHRHVIMTRMMRRVTMIPQILKHSSHQSQLLCILWPSCLLSIYRDNSQQHRPAVLNPVPIACCPYNQLLLFLPQEKETAHLLMLRLFFLDPNRPCMKMIAPAPGAL